MKNVLHHKNWNIVTVQLHVGTPPIPILESNNKYKLDKYCVKIKFRRYPTSQKLDLYGFKMSLFDNLNTGEFLLFVSNFSMNLEASGNLVASTNIQYLLTLIIGEALHQYDMFPAKVGSTTSENLKSIILCLGPYFFPVNELSKQKWCAVEWIIRAF